MVCTFIFGYVVPLILISFCYAKVSVSSLIVVDEENLNVMWLDHDLFNAKRNLGLFQNLTTNKNVQN